MVDITRTVTPAGKEKVSTIAKQAELMDVARGPDDVAFYIRTTQPITLMAGNLLEVVLTKDELAQLVAR
jgi:hypothetical protein